MPALHPPCVERREASGGTHGNMENAVWWGQCVRGWVQNMPSPQTRPPALDGLMGRQLGCPRKAGRQPVRTKSLSAREQSPSRVITDAVALMWDLGYPGSLDVCRGWLGAARDVGRRGELWTQVRSRLGVS